MSELASFGKLLIQQLNENLEKELEIRNLINKYSKNNENSNNKEYHKGISEATISIIEEKMKNYTEYIMIEEISQITGLSNKTVNKYMNHLVKYGYVDSRIVYGKIGRPRNEYLWIKK